MAGDMIRPDAPMPAYGNCTTEDALTGVIAADDIDKVVEGLKLDLLRCLRGTGFLREPPDFSFALDAN